ncbi:MAG: GDSL-type esterase/lipase family protein [Candidatus Parcubacteria bacterium]|nr:GDSL-type esterase/lipase family protein [Candidatus Parcubacteria bacterium]
MATYLIFGASITYGAWDTEKGGWVQRLRNFIEEKNEMSDIVYNLGISGETTNDILKRFKIETEQRLKENWGKSPVIIFSLDINDSITLIKENKLMIPMEKCKENLQELLGLAKNYTDKVIVVGPSSIDEKVANPWDENIEYYNKDIKENNEIARKLCDENHILFIEMFNILEKDDLEDGLHPNAQGHEKIFQIVKENLIKNKII